MTDYSVSQFLWKNKATNSTRSSRDRTVGQRLPARDTAPPSAPSPSHLALHKLLSIALKYLQQPATADTPVHVGYNLMLKLLSSRFGALSSSSMSVSPKSQVGCLSAAPDVCTPLLLAPSVHTYTHMPNTPSHRHLLTIPITKWSEIPIQKTPTDTHYMYHRHPTLPAHTPLVINTQHTTKVTVENILCEANRTCEWLLVIPIPCIFPQNMFSPHIYRNTIHMLNSAMM